MKSETLEVLKEVIKNYDLSGELTEAEQCVNGHINDTYRVTLKRDDGSSDELILQRINSYVFKEPVKVMHNIRVVNRHLKSKKTDPGCGIISFLNNKNGENYTVVQGEYWRVCRCIEDSVTHEVVENSRVLYSAGYAFGRFQSVLSDLPLDKLHETIPDFHNTRKRLETLFETAAQDPEDRAGDVKKELSFFEEHRELACRLCDMEKKGEIPLRVTHNDTKYNNILMHKKTDEPLCVIDLDTVMPGLAMHDFGDAVRFAANTAVEDETDLSKVGLNMEHYTEFTRGFMEACQDFLTKKEIETMALGAIVITIELASRFLADHIEGDQYFRIHRENHNLDRARCQIELARDMIAKYNEMCRIVDESVQDSTAFDEVQVAKR